MANDTARLSPFGQQLRRWRDRRGTSQLELAAKAGTTARHISFVETGRSRPGRDLVLRLASALDVPIRERNGLLVSAGLAAEFPVYDLSDEPMLPVNNVLRMVLRSHEPYPAWVFAPGFQALSANAAGDALFPGLCKLSPETIVDMWFAPGPFRQMVENWREVIWAGIDNLHREAARTSDPRVLALLRRAEGHAAHIPAPESRARPDLPVACPRFNIGGRIVRTISAVLRFDTAIEVTASELRVELMFPADAESDAYFREAARARPSLTVPETSRPPAARAGP
jgi:transcriptional regulator with XRE-family HTH domain